MTKNGKISVVGYTFGHSENVTPLISSACFQTRIFVFILRQRKSQHEIVLHCQPASPMDGQMDMQSLHKYTLTWFFKWIKSNVFQKWEKQVVPSVLVRSRCSSSICFLTNLTRSSLERDSSWNQFHMVTKTGITETLYQVSVVCHVKSFLDLESCPTSFSFSLTMHTCIHVWMTLDGVILHMADLTWNFGAFAV